MIKAVSIFSGAGGLDVGARNAGVEIIACVENDRDAAETLRLNSDSEATEIIEGDIEDVAFKRWRSPEPMILIGGPPCQPFSKNGYWVKNDNRLIENDPRNMLGQFLRGLKEMKPAGFLFENVESILHPSNKGAFEAFLARAKSLGYGCTVYRANAADFGVPQKRKRVFVFGLKGSRYGLPDPCRTHADSKEGLDLPPHVGVGKHIRKFSAEKYFEPQEVAAGGTYFNELKAVPAGKNYISLSKLSGYRGRTFRSGGRFWNFLQKLHPDEPSITIAAQPGPWVGPFHWENRRLRVPEIAAIQTFPASYGFAGSRRSIQKQIGNAVPCLLGEHMVRHLVGHL